MTMSVCRAAAGLAGAGELLGVAHHMSSSYGTTVGFDSIAIALLGARRRLGSSCCPCCSVAARRFPPMPIQTGIPAEIVDVLQATMLLFLVATPVLRVGSSRAAD